jgi:hypothetical protein
MSYLKIVSLFAGFALAELCTFNFQGQQCLHPNNLLIFHINYLHPQFQILQSTLCTEGPRLTRILGLEKNHIKRNLC